VPRGERRDLVIAHVPRVVERVARAARVGGHGGITRAVVASTIIAETARASSYDVSANGPTPPSL